MFVDHIRVHGRAGRGGDGRVHFHRGKFRPKGGPDGGDGGRGGDVILVVDNSTDSLRTFFFNGKLHAEDGKLGGDSNKTGRAGESNTYKVPPGLLISRFVERFNEETGEVEEDLEVVADLTEIGQEFILCKGGKGGKGNQNYATATHQAPREFTPGQDGEEGNFYFELRSIADTGLVGLPNAGKSTLLSKLSAAKPKIANYPFTTLQPMVGVIEFGNFRRGTMADIPGLIEGAHQNIGLGHDFLRHIQRCRILVFVVDTAGTEGRDPIADIQTLRMEIKLYDSEMAKRPWVILCNKMDLPEAEEHFLQIKERFKRVKIFPISADTGLGLDKLRKYLDDKIGEQVKW
ncbi:MAG: GTP-binding protein Obg/CgtA [Verrucomicrobiaceae bacterium]|nr:GTP-binding protein Obg/CgtA [Verrucomicrobiaceae bacterium]